MFWSWEGCCTYRFSHGSFWQITMGEESGQLQFDRWVLMSSVWVKEYVCDFTNIGQWDTQISTIFNMAYVHKICLCWWWCGGMPVSSWIVTQSRIQVNLVWNLVNTIWGTSIQMWSKSGYKSITLLFPGQTIPTILCPNSALQKYKESLANFHMF